MAGKVKLDLSVVGQTGLPVWSGRVYDEMLRELEGDRGRKIFREMSEQDPIIGGTLLGIEMLARQVSWSLKPADDSDKAAEVAEFVDGALSDMHPTFGSVMSEILSMLTYGWSWLEIIYKKREGLDIGNSTKTSLFEDGKVGWGSWSIRSQETLYTWEFDGPNKDVGNVVAMIQNPPPNYPMLRIPRSKALHFKTRSRRENPEGVSILRNAYRSWYMKNNIEVIEGIGIERDLAGLPVLWAPEQLFSSTAEPGEKELFAKLQKIVTSIKRDEQEGILMPMAYDEEGKNALYKLELLSTGGDRQFDTNSIINRYDERIAMSMLADFILMGHQAVGSFALSTSKTGMFNTAMSAILDVIADEVNAQAIPKLVVLNGYPLDMTPTLMHGKVEAADMSKLADFLNQLSAAGMQVFPNMTLEKYLLETAGLPGQEEIQAAGEFPVDELGNPLPIDPLTGLPVQPALLPPTTGSPGSAAPKAGVPNASAAVAKPRATPSRAVALPKEQARQKTRVPRAPAPAAKAAVEPRPKHFTPLPVRVNRITDQLEERMEPDAFTDFLHEVLSLGKFSLLKKQYQEAILAVEGGSR